MAKLTEKQKRFCDEYLIDLNATQAAIRAGYSAKNANNIASENLAKPNIQNYIRERMNEKESKLIADQDEILQYLTSVLRGEPMAAVVKDTENGAIVLSLPPEVKERTKAAELLGKRYGLYVEKTDINVSGVNITESAQRLMEVFKGIKEDGT